VQEQDDVQAAPLFIIDETCRRHYIPHRLPLSSTPSNMLATILLSIIIALLSFYEYRRRHHHHGHVTPLIQTFGLVAHLDKLNLTQWKQSHREVASLQNGAATATRCREAASRFRNSSRVMYKTTKDHTSTRHVEFYKPSRAEGASATRLPTTPTPAPRRSRSPLPLSPRHLESGKTWEMSRDTLLLPFSFSAPPLGQKALPGFSFSDLPIPVASPPAAASPSTPQHARPHQHSRSEPPAPEPLESPWHPSFAVRSKNAQKSNDFTQGTATWNVSPDSVPINDVPSRGAGVGKSRARKGAGRTMRRVAARFGHQLVKLDDNREDGGSGSESREVEKRAVIGMGRPMAEMDAPAAALFTPPVSPRTLHEAALSSHPPPPTLASGPRPGEGVFDITRSAPTPSLAPAPVHGRRGRGSLKHRLNRVQTAFGFSVELPPPDPELFTPRAGLRRQQQQQQGQQNRASSSGFGRGGGGSGDVDGSRGKGSLWKFGAGRKRERERERLSGVFDANGVGMVRCDSLQHEPEMLAAAGGGEERQGGGYVQKKRVRVR